MLADLFSYLTTAPGVGADPDRSAALTSLQALIVGGSPVVSRLYPDFLTERSTMPAVVYQQIDGSHLGYTLEGDHVDIDNPRVQFDVYSYNPVERETVSDYLKTALDGFSGTMGGTDVAILLFDNEQNSYESDSKQYRKTLDFRVVHYS